jgi:YD repeat-containing protein
VKAVCFGRSAARPPAGRLSDLVSLFGLEPVDVLSVRLSFRRPGRSPLVRLLVHVLIRLLVLGPMPADVQALSAVFPISILAPLLVPSPSAHKEEEVVKKALPQTPSHRPDVGGGSGDGARSRRERTKEVAGNDEDGALSRDWGGAEQTVVEQSQYDGNGNRVLSTDGEGHQTRFDYDAANRLARRVDGLASPVESSIRYTVDPNGNVTDEIDDRTPKGIHREFDPLNRVSSVRDGVGNTTAYGYDG